MNAELIVVNGPAAGTRFALDPTETLIGRATNATIVLPEPEVGWRHCQIRRQGNRFVIVDLRSSLGTYVNGMRSAERWLEDRDQIGVGKTILMFRNGEGASAETASRATADATGAGFDTKPVLLSACSLVFLFRALAASIGEEQNELLQGQILRLVGDLIPVTEGLLLLGTSAADLQSRYREMHPATRWDCMM